jgi:hypothetical protein
MQDCKAGWGNKDREAADLEAFLAEQPVTTKGFRATVDTALQRLPRIVHRALPEVCRLIVARGEALEDVLVRGAPDANGSDDFRGVLSSHLRVRCLSKVQDACRHQAPRRVLLCSAP